MYYIGGGFLCIKGQYLLLGREFYGKNRGLYADFGGGRDSSDRNINDTIKREVKEEFYINIENIYQLPYVNIPSRNNKFYKLVIGCIDNYQFDYFYKTRQYFMNLSENKYSKYTEIDKITLVPIINIIQAIQQNKNYIKDTNENKIKLRNRLWKALKYTQLLDIIMNINNNN